MPSSICKKCIEYATLGYKFKVNCERTEALLQNYVTRKSNNDNNLSYKTNQDVEDKTNKVRIEINTRTDNLSVNFEEECDHIQDIDDSQIVNCENGVEQTEDSEEPCFQEVELKPQFEDIKEEYEAKYEEIEDNQNENEEQDQLEEEENEYIENTETNSDNILNEGESEKLNEENYANNSETEGLLIASIAAATEDNLRLREKIEMKKKKLLEKSTGEEQQKTKKKYFYDVSFNDKGRYFYHNNHSR